MSERRTRIGMVVLGLVIWAGAIAYPGWQIPSMLLGVAMVVFASFGLLSEESHSVGG
jgi:hypothetical protein